MRKLKDISIQRKYAKIPITYPLSASTCTSESENETTSGWNWKVIRDGEALAIVTFALNLLAT